MEPAIYRTNELKRVNYYLGEKTIATYFGKTKYRTAHILLNNMCNSTSNTCNYIIDHIGKNSSLKNRNICNIFLF